LKVEVDVLEEGAVFSDSVHDFGDLDAVDRAAGDVGLHDSAFTVRKDVGSHEFPIIGKTINGFLLNSKERRVCASDGGAKNLVKVESRIEKRAAGATANLTEVNITGKLVEFAWWMKKQGYRESTICVTSQRLKHLVKLGADLFDPESIKEKIALQKCQESTKVTYVNSYARFAEMHDLQFTKPRYRIDHQKLPFIPTETEIDQLIASCSKKVSTFLQLLKETGMRSGEAFKLSWKDMDLITKTVRVNNPGKRGNSRIIKISDKVIAMLKALPQKSDQVFKGSVHGLRTNFGIQRKRAAEKLKNPRLLRISFHTLRHWKATMEYHKTKDILHVMKLLGHKSINSTLLYTQLVNLEGDEYDVKVAETTKEITELLEAGFEWVGQDNSGLTYFRKRK
jgi:integrase